MKVYALAILLLFCIVENTTASWKDDVLINHWQQINTIINSALEDIRADADKKGTPAAQQCAEEAREELKTISDSGFSDVSSCVSSASNAGDAHVCCQSVDSRVFNYALEVSKSAGTCINNA